MFGFGAGFLGRGLAWGGWGMARAGTGPSAGVQRTIAAYVRAGAYPAVAAEAAGVPAAVFRAWMERGARPSGQGRLPRFSCCCDRGRRPGSGDCGTGLLHGRPQDVADERAGPGDRRDTRDGRAWFVRSSHCTDNRSVNLLTDPTSSALSDPAPGRPESLPGGSACCHRRLERGRTEGPCDSVPPGPFGRAVVPARCCATAAMPSPGRPPQPPGRLLLWTSPSGLCS